MNESIMKTDRRGRLRYTPEPTPISPPSGPVTASFNGLHRESNFLAIKGGGGFFSVKMLERSSAG